MDSIDRLAKKIADMNRDTKNKPSTSPRIGEVVSVQPLKISVGDQIVLQEDKLYLPKLYRDGYMIPNKYIDTNGQVNEDPILWKLDFSIGDNVIISPDENLKMWFVSEIL